MSHRRFRSRVRVTVEQLEDRNAPVASPLGDRALRILGAYGQLQTATGYVQRCLAIFSSTVTIFAIAMLSWAPLFGQEKQSRPKENKTPDVVRLPLKDLQPSPSNKATVKKDGVEITFEVQLDEKRNTTDLLIKWKLRNTGPRPALVIERPSLETRATRLYFFACAKGKDYAVSSLYMPNFSDWQLATKESFVTIPKGEGVSGKLVVSGTRLKKILTVEHPDEFKGDEIQALYLSILHLSDDGKKFNLDAWTEGLLSGLFSVGQIRKW